MPSIESRTVPTATYDATVSRDPRSSIGEPGEPVRAIAFAGGLFDAAMQLGMAHALLVSDSVAPDVVVGISSGAINAVALAEILQAGNSSESEHSQIEAKVARFRAVLEAYRQSPEDVLSAFLPDIYQVDAEAPLKPTELPIYKKAERDDRFRAARSRAGLIKLANDLLRLDVSIGSITRGVRACLGLRAMAEVRPVWRRYAGKIVECWRLWRVLASNIVGLAPIGVRLIEIGIAPHADRLGEWLQTSPIGNAIARGIAAPLPNVTGQQIVDWVVRRIASLRSTEEAGSSAGSLLFRGAIRQRAVRSIRWSTGFVILLLVFGAPLFALVGVATAVAYWSSPVAHRVLAAAHAWLDQSWTIDAPLHAITMTELIAFGGTALIVAVVISMRGWLTVDRVLRYYGISDAILDPYPVRSWFVRLFDPQYYGTSNMDAIVEAALTTQRLDQASSMKSAVGQPRKTLMTYVTHSSPIHVGPMAADVRTGQLKVLPAETPVVDALLAATAMPPYFEAQKCGDSWLIDGTVVANEPTRALLAHLTPLVHEDATAVHIYPVSSLPLGATELGVDQPEYSGLVESSRRALALQSFRDATLDRRMTDLVSRALPGDRAAWWPGREAKEKRGGRQFLRANVFPIELDSVASLNERLLAAHSVAERRELIVESVAEGCRLSLEVILHDQLLGSGDDVVKCRTVIRSRVGNQRALPGSGMTGGPGLPEVCRACALHKGASIGRSPIAEQSLRVPTADRKLPLWPVTGEKTRTRSANTPQSKSEVPLATSASTPLLTTAMDWPAKRDAKAEAGAARPTVSLLFSGGVFRGVYLAGVITALNEMGIEPDLIAGSSIGSITAAMAARVFATPANQQAERRRRLHRIAATYLAVDRLVLTDRFADFIRNFTLRAGATTFSLRDLDTTFRVFDRSKTEEFGRELRKVLAGLERLLYVSPFEARDLALAFRMRRYNRVASLLGEFAQEWLERGAVGLEILGSEPLALLIREHVLDGTGTAGSDPAAGFVEMLKVRGIQFIATATNLTRGRLDQLHIPPTSNEQKARLVETLLASSAFPAVFRPRWTWEVAPETSAVEQYIDGGVMDNLPLDAVARYLDDARKANKVVARPRVDDAPVPHLLFTASLEVERPELSNEATTYTAKRWLEAQRRAKELSYNNKIDGYAKTQRDLRLIWDAGGKDETRPFIPLDLEVVTVKPQWLCGTFAFHPMLGFRRSDQARSIAHGCKTTFEAIYQLSRTNPAWIKGWSIGSPAEWSDTPNRENEAKGECWYRTGCQCPFSQQALDQAGSSALAAKTREAVEQIYHLCRKRKTHARRDPNRVLAPSPIPGSPG